MTLPTPRQLAIKQSQKEYDDAVAVREAQINAAKKPLLDRRAELKKRFYEDKSISEENYRAKMKEVRKALEKVDREAKAGRLVSGSDALRYSQAQIKSQDARVAAQKVKNQGVTQERIAQGLYATVRKGDSELARERVAARRSKIIQSQLTDNAINNYYEATRLEPGVYNTASGKQLIVKEGVAARTAGELLPTITEGKYDYVRQPKKLSVKILSDNKETTFTPTKTGLKSNTIIKPSLFTNNIGLISEAPTTSKTEQFKYFFNLQNKDYLESSLGKKLTYGFRKKDYLLKIPELYYTSDLVAKQNVYGGFSKEGLSVTPELIGTSAKQSALRILGSPKEQSLLAATFVLPQLRGSAGANTINFVEGTRYAPSLLTSAEAVTAAGFFGAAKEEAPAVVIGSAAPYVIAGVSGELVANPKAVKAFIKQNIKNSRILAEKTSKLYTNMNKAGKIGGRSAKQRAGVKSKAEIKKINRQQSYDPRVTLSNGELNIRIRSKALKADQFTKERVLKTRVTPKGFRTKVYDRLLRQDNPNLKGSGSPSSKVRYRRSQALAGIGKRVNIRPNEVFVIEKTGRSVSNKPIYKPNNKVIKPISNKPNNKVIKPISNKDLLLKTINKKDLLVNNKNVFKSVKREPSYKQLGFLKGSDPFLKNKNLRYVEVSKDYWVPEWYAKERGMMRRGWREGTYERYMRERPVEFIKPSKDLMINSDKSLINVNRPVNSLKPSVNVVSGSKLFSIPSFESSVKVISTPKLINLTSASFIQDQTFYPETPTISKETKPPSIKDNFIKPTVVNERIVTDKSFFPQNLTKPEERIVRSFIPPELPKVSLPKFDLPKRSLGAGKKKKTDSKFKFSYNPSVYAIGLGIKGKKPTKEALKSGLAIRPIIKGGR